MPWSRRARFVSVGGVVALLVVGGLVWRARASDDPARPVIGSATKAHHCGGYSGEGARLHDQPLLERALAAWQDDIADDRADAKGDGKEGDDLPEELRRDVCVAYADTVGDKVLVTMINGRRRATYVESTEARRGHMTNSGDISPGFDAPAIPMAEGLWILSSSARDHVLLVAGGAEAAKTVELSPTSPVIDVGKALDGAGDKAAGVLLVRMRQTLYGIAATESGADAPYVRFGGADTRPSVEAILSAPGGVPLVAQAITNDASGKEQSALLTRQLSLVGRVDVPGVGPALAVAEQPAGVAQQDSAVQLVYLVKDRPQQVPLGSFNESGGWAGGVWVVGRQDEPDPYVFVAVGVPPTTTEAALSLQVRIGKDTVTRKGPIALVTRADVPAIVHGKTRPATLVIGSRADGSIVSTLGTTQ